jgi:HK97 family phage portal protein
MNFRAVISRLPGIGAMVARSLGWQSAMFGDLLDGGGGNSSPDLTRPYAKSAWVRAAIKFVAGPISMRPLIITSDRRGGDVVVDNPELTRFWETPARDASGMMTRQIFIEAIVALLKLKGQSFLIMDDTWFTPRAKKSPLILAKADAMHAIIEGGELIGWTYTDANRQRGALIPDQVIQIKNWNPYHDVLGLSEWEAAMIAAQSDYAAGTFARNLAMNNGDRGPFVIGKGGQFTDDQIKQVTAQLRMKRELGRRGEFRAAFLPADVDVKDPSLNAVDSAYVAQRLENRKEVFIALGVPPSFADPQASYSIGSASDRFRLIEDECMPLAAKIADAFEIISAKFLGGSATIFVEFDWDSHSTMQQVRSERFETAVKAVDRGMPWKVAGEYFRLKLPRFRGDDVGRVPFNLTEIEDVSDLSDPTDPPELAEDPVEELQQLFASRTQGTPVVTPKAPSAKAAAAWQRVRKYREPWEKKFAAKVSRYLMDARAETLRKIAAAASTEKAVRTPDVLSLVFDLDAWLQEWIKGLLSISRAAIEQAGIEVWSEELRRDDPMTQPAAEVLEALNIRENRLSGAGQKVWEAVRDELQAGIDAGDTMEQLAERTRRKFRGIDKSRSMAIAKTETTVAYEFARDLAFRAAGVQWKQWLTSGLGNERLSHYAANEQIVPVDEKFNVGGFEMSYPGDPEAPAKEVINCNCVTIAVSDPAEDDDFNNDDSIPY